MNGEYEEIKMKFCSGCGQEKPLSEFYPRSDKKHLKKSLCKLCQSAYYTAYWKAQWQKTKNNSEEHEREKARLKKARLNYYEKNKEKINELARNKAYSLKQRFWAIGRCANLRKVEQQISFPQYEKLLELPCEYCGDPNLSRTGHHLDRIDNHLGYSVENVVKCCSLCNTIKSDTLSYNEMKIIGEAVRLVKAQRLEKSVQSIVNKGGN